MNEGSTISQLTVIGWDGSPLSPIARAALDAATLVVGGARHLAAMTAMEAAAEQAARIVLGKLDPALAAVAAHDGPVVVLASGDPGFFGIVRALRERGLEPQVLPAVSSVAAAFARAGESWDDALVASAHGHVGSGGEGGGERGLRRSANLCRAHGKVAVLTTRGAGPGELARELLTDPRCTPDRVLVVAERLGMPDETVIRLSLEEAAERSDWGEPNVVLCLDPRRAVPDLGWLAGQSRAQGSLGWALPESGFEHRDSMITKAEVRALALPRLAPAPGELVWDLGAGSGSVGIECARFGAAVVAVEQDAESAARIPANAAAHSVEIAVVTGRMPEVLAGLPRPDAVFVGGGGLDTLRAALGFAPRRVVAAVTAIERAGETASLLAADNRKVDGVLTQSSRLAVLPDGSHRFAAQNPVFVIWGESI
jgi:precorrin-6Y C5,15-methyltransferase (decarboxylating)